MALLALPPMLLISHGGYSCSNRPNRPTPYPNGPIGVHLYLGVIARI